MTGKKRDYYYEALGWQDDAGNLMTAIKVCTEGIEHGADDVLRYGPEKVMLYSLRSTFFAFTGNFDAAIGDLDSVIDICTRNTKSALCDLARHYAYRGSLHFRKGAYHEAIADYTQAIDLEPSKYPVRYFERSRARYLCEDSSGAIHDLEQVLELVDEHHNDAIEAREIITKIEQGTW